MVIHDINNNYSKALFIFIIASLTQSTTCKDGFSKREKDRIDSVLKKSFECHNNPGLSVAVVKDGKIIFSKGYGVKDLETKSRVNDDTLFGIASVSKSFAATLLVKLLYEKTRLNVSSKVHELLGDKFQMPDNTRTSETTFADLMAHRVGVTPNNRIRFNENITRENLIEHIALLKAPKQFRVDYYYSNLMYGLVTYLAEVIGNATWEELVHDHLYKPLGMSRSTFLTVDSSYSNVATGYYSKNAGPMLPVSEELSRHWALLAGSGAVVSSAKDMARWMNFHLFQGINQKGQTVMSKKHLTEVHKGRFFIPYGKETYKPRFPVTSTSEVYAHGLRRGFYRGYEKLSHTGSTVGYQSLMTLLPQQKIGVFTVLTGRDSGYLYRRPLHMYLMDMALGIKPWLNSSTICSYPAPWKRKKSPSKPVTLDSKIKLKRAIKEYEGSYFNDAYGYLTVKYSKKLRSLVMKFGWGTWRLYRRPKYSGDKFYGDGMATTFVFDISPIEFLVDPKNSSHITAIKPIAFDSILPPVFQKHYHGIPTTPPVNNSILPILCGFNVTDPPKLNASYIITGEEENNHGPDIENILKQLSSIRTDTSQQFEVLTNNIGALKTELTVMHNDVNLIKAQMWDVSVDKNSVREQIDVQNRSIDVLQNDIAVAQDRMETIEEAMKMPPST